MDWIEYHVPSGGSHAHWTINGAPSTEPEVIVNLARTLEKLEQLIKDPQAADFYPKQ